MSETTRHDTPMAAVWANNDDAYRVLTKLNTPGRPLPSEGEMRLTALNFQASTNLVLTALVEAVDNLAAQVARVFPNRNVDE